MFFDHEIRAFIAKVAFYSGIPSSKFSEEEILFIENAFIYNDKADDVAYTVATGRTIRSEIVE